MILLRIKNVVIFYIITVLNMSVVTKAEDETKDEYSYKNSDGTLSCSHNKNIPFHTESICSQDSTIIDDITILTEYQDIVNTYETTTPIELSMEPLKMAEISSITPTGTLVEQNSLYIVQTTTSAFTINPLHPNLSTKDESVAEDDILSILPTPTKPIGIEEIVAAMEPTIPSNFITTGTIPIQTVATMEFAKPTGTIIPTDAKEPISATTPPNVILPTKTTTEITLSGTLSKEEVTSTDPLMVIQKATAVFTTEHTGVIEPTLVGDYTVISNNILKTSEPVINTVASSALKDFVEPSNTSVVVSEGTATPSLPTNISKIIVL